MKKSHITPQMAGLSAQPMTPLCASSCGVSVTSAKGGDEPSRGRNSCDYDYDPDEACECGSLW